jgi:hypothetical protein
MKHREIPHRPCEIEIVFTYEEAEELEKYLNRAFYDTPDSPSEIESTLREALKDHIND